MMDANNLAKLDLVMRTGVRAVGGLYRRTRGKEGEKRSAWEVASTASRGASGCRPADRASRRS